MRGLIRVTYERVSWIEITLINKLKDKTVYVKFKTPLLSTDRINYDMLYRDMDRI